eukprot:m.1137340 g.1137340  ORF g.1137340 m.1137340 type:complete len:332 (-) comp24435_c0_seq16:145-1140(-)
MALMTSAPRIPPTTAHTGPISTDGFVSVASTASDTASSGSSAVRMTALRTCFNASRSAAPAASRLNFSWNWLAIRNSGSTMGLCLGILPVDPHLCAIADASETKDMWCRSFTTVSSPVLLRIFFSSMNSWSSRFAKVNPWKPTTPAAKNFTPPLRHASSTRANPDNGNPVAHTISKCSSVKNVSVLSLTSCVSTLISTFGFSRCNPGSEATAIFFPMSLSLRKNCDARCRGDTILLSNKVREPMPERTMFLQSSAATPEVPITSTLEARNLFCASSPHNRICRSYCVASLEDKFPPAGTSTRARFFSCGSDSTVVIISFFDEERRGAHSKV